MSPQITQLLISGGVVIAAALAAAVLVPEAVRRLGRRWPPAGQLVAAARTPFRILVLMIAVNAIVAANRPRGDGAEWWDYGAHALRIVGIVNGTWLIGVVFLFVIDAALRRANSGLDARNAKRVQTQVQVLRRIVIALIVVFAVAAVLLTFDGVRAVGASLLASAGVISVVAAVAAQATLGNLFAGLQLAFSDAVRLDDVVIVEDEYGTIEEITLSYVVVKLWDDRRLMLPCTYFTSTPFQNWTRRDSEMMGTAEFDLDWRIDCEGMRAEFERILADSMFFNGRSSGLSVIQSTEGFVKVRVSFTADDPSRLWDLGCHVREALIRWVQLENPEALPRTRVEFAEASADADRRLQRA